MPGQTWLGAEAAFVGTWVTMMAAMMLPSLVPPLWRYRAALGAPALRRGWLTLLVGAGYFAVWAALGAILFPTGIAFGEIATRVWVLARAVPVIGGAVVVIAGCLQCTGWKARQLDSCRESKIHGADGATRADAAWRHGVSLGIRCIRSCAGLTAVMLALGVMDLRVTAVAAIAITAERLAPNGALVARVVGVLVIAMGLLMIAQAPALG